MDVGTSKPHPTANAKLPFSHLSTQLHIKVQVSQTCETAKPHNNKWISVLNVGESDAYLKTTAQCKTAIVQPSLCKLLWPLQVQQLEERLDSTIYNARWFYLSCTKTKTVQRRKSPPRTLPVYENPRGHSLPRSIINDDKQEWSMIPPRSWDISLCNCIKNLLTTRQTEYSKNRSFEVLIIRVLPIHAEIASNIRILDMATYLKDGTTLFAEK